MEGEPVPILATDLCSPALAVGESGTCSQATRLLVAIEAGHQTAQREAASLGEQLLALRRECHPHQQQLCAHQRAERLEERDAERPEAAVQRACGDLALQSHAAQRFSSSGRCTETDPFFFGRCHTGG